mmetsp:Transcript_9527/g.14023  ORF Transcript_9527/g.14023 Transcript_9527/m.14023 type:complete len:330 (+) Transcript_9527:130-1119(+)
MAAQLKNHPRSSPPTPSVALVILVSAICMTSIPNILSTIDDVATIERCTMPLFPKIMSRSTLGWIRLGFASFIGLTSIGRMLESHEVRMNYMKHSKLRSMPIQMEGFRAQAYFTSWHWNLLGLSFTTSGLLTLFIDAYTKNQPLTSTSTHTDILSTSPHIKYLLRSTVLLFETAAPLSLLVSFVVRYALWPKALKGSMETEGFKKTTALIQHNANIIMSLTEIGLLGGLPMRFTDMALAPMVGIVYIVFAWSVRFQLTSCGSPQFLYFFLDTTLGTTSTVALLILLVVLVGFYAMFVSFAHVIVWFGGGVKTHATLVGLIASLACRFRD